MLLVYKSNFKKNSIWLYRAFHTTIGVKLWDGKGTNGIYIYFCSGAIPDGLSSFHNGLLLGLPICLTEVYKTHIGSSRRMVVRHSIVSRNIPVAVFQIIWPCFRNLLHVSMELFIRSSFILSLPLISPKWPAIWYSSSKRAV